MNVDRYNVYAASTTSSGVQPVIMVEPAVQKLSASVGFNTETFIEYALLKVLKTDKSGAPSAGCTFQISYQQDDTPKTQEQTTDGNGEAKFMDLPLNTDVTIKETEAPEGYTLLPDKVVNTGSTGGKTVEVTLTNSDDHVFKVHKTSSADGRNLMGAKFEVKGIDNDFVNTYTTDALGEFTIQGRDRPTGSFEVYEIAAPEGYATDGADIQTFSWDNTRDITLSFQNAPLLGIEIQVRQGQQGAMYGRSTTRPRPSISSSRPTQTIRVLSTRAIWIYLDNRVGWTRRTDSDIPARRIMCRIPATHSTVPVAGADGTVGGWLRLVWSKRKPYKARHVARRYRHK